ncbi:lamin tail domain-containing protein, partial [Candidatus Parcubacteria bacterium]|nr:lamin tail domain-containing protein [Candidatus Parcubacteria bacterium]
MSKGKKIISIFLVFIFFCGSFFAYNSFILASDVDHIVISEIQIGGESVYDEFIELYNPTNLDVNLNEWDLKRKTKSGTESNMLNNIKGVIPAYGYFLIVPRSNCGDGNDEDCYKGLIIADDEYTTDSFLAKDNAILLYDSDGNLVDKVGWGNAVDFESKVITDNPEDDQSLKRKGAGYIVQDTDNNNADFILQAVPNPQNSSVINDQEGSTQENGANDIDN